MDWNKKKIKDGVIMVEGCSINGQTIELFGKGITNLNYMELFSGLE